MLRMSPLWEPAIFTDAVPSLALGRLSSPWDAAFFSQRHNTRLTLITRRPGVGGVSMVLPQDHLRQSSASHLGKPPG